MGPRAHVRTSRAQCRDVSAEPAPRSSESSSSVFGWHTVSTPPVAAHDVDDALEDTVIVPYGVKQRATDMVHERRRRLEHDHALAVQPATAGPARVTEQRRL